MKKVVMIALVAVLVIAMATTAFAGTINDPSPQNTTAVGNTVPMYGYIGPDGTINPGVPPTVTTINASIPTQMLWAAFESDFTSGSASLTSANHYVECRTGSADLDVTVASFAQTDSTVLPGTLALGLSVTDTVGTSRLANVANLFTLGANGVKIASMTQGDKINMTVTGSYAHTAFPSVAFQPEYDLVLRLDAI